MNAKERTLESERARERARLGESTRMVRTNVGDEQERGRPSSSETFDILHHILYRVVRSTSSSRDSLAGTASSLHRTKTFSTSDGPL